MTRTVRHSRLLLFLLALSAIAARHVFAAADEAAWTTTSELWYTMELANAPAGWMHITEETDGSNFRTTSTTRLSIGRGSTATKAEITSVFVEAADHAPIRMRYAQNMSAQVVETEWVFEGDSIVKKSSQGGQVTESRLEPFEGEWLSPRSAQARLRDAIANGEKKVEYALLDGSGGARPVDVTHERVGQETIEINGKPIEVTIWNTTTSAMPIVAREAYDAEGELVTQEVDIGVGKLIARRATREQAMHAGQGNGPELLVASFVKPDKPLSRLSQIERLQMRLHMKDDAELPAMPTAGAQRATMADDKKSATLIIMPGVKQAVDVPADAPQGDADEFIEPSTMINSDDDVVMELAQRAVRRSADDAMAKAEALRAFVRRHISSKGLEVAFATAGETARNKKGDCSEHAVLLAAMMRAQKIPARVVTGLVYADSFSGHQDIFGWHMWTQAWIDGKWIDFDATLPTRFNAGHIMVSASSLADGIADADFAALILIIGRLEVDVVDVQYAGENKADEAR